MTGPYLSGRCTVVVAAAAAAVVVVGRSLVPEIVSVVSSIWGSGEVACCNGEIMHTDTDKNTYNRLKRDLGLSGYCTDHND